jgi:S-formylglutathione hydrolase FrmB
MKPAAAFILLLSACAAKTVATPPPAAPVAPASAASAAPGKGTVSTRTFFSDALGVDKRYVVYLPAGYDSSDARYPVIYMLNGLGGDETNWVKHGHADVAADALGLRAILVMPDGDSGWYVNGALPVDYDACITKGEGLFGRVTDRATFCVRTPKYEDYIVKDLVAHVDATYRTIPERRARALTGVSMGGFGALQLAMRHQDEFASAASHSGVDSLLYAGPWPYEAGKVKLVEDVTKWGAEVEPIGAWVRFVFGADIANWKAHDPAVLAAGLKDGALAIYLDAGTADDFGLNAGAAYLHDVLGKAGVTHAYTVVDGARHSFSFWKDRIDDSLAFHAAAFARAGL